MQDAKIISNTHSISEGVLMDKKRIDLIFCSVNKHKPNMTFENFLQALTKIAEFKYGEGNKVESLQYLITNNLLPLQEKI